MAVNFFNLIPLSTEYQIQKRQNKSKYRKSGVKDLFLIAVKHTAVKEKRAQRKHGSAAERKFDPLFFERKRFAGAVKKQRDL